MAVSGSAEVGRAVCWGEFLDEATGRLAAAGVASAASEARRIVVAAAGCDDAGWHAVLPTAATRRGVAAFDRMLARRAAGEPLQYVLGSWGFRTLDLFVDSRVLIPRPETETVVGCALDELRHRADELAGAGEGSSGSGGGGGVPLRSSVQGRRVVADRPPAPPLPLSLGEGDPSARPRAGEELSGSGGGGGVPLRSATQGRRVVAGRPPAPPPPSSPLGEGDPSAPPCEGEKMSGSGGGGGVPLGSATQGRRVVAGRPPAPPPPVEPALLAADLGCGSGAIGLSLAVERPDVEVVCTDVSADALAVASANLAGLGRPARRVRLAEGSWFEALPEEYRGCFDVIVSNPPYIAVDDPLPPEVADHEPQVALYSGRTGLEATSTILSGAPVWLAPGGAVVLELADGTAGPVRELAQSAGLVDVAVHRDLAGRERVLVARRRS